MQYRKKPVVIDAIRWTEETPDDDIIQFLDGCEWFSEDGINIVTLEGTMKVSKGDWIIKGVKGEFYPCKPDIFDATYDVA